VNPNPYAAPQTRPEPPGTPTRPRLFGATAVAVHFVIFPLFGALLAATNYHRAKDGAGFWRAATLFVGAAVGLSAFGLAIHNRGQIILLWCARIALAALLFFDQRPLLQRHVAAGGRKARWALAWLFAFPFLALVGLAVWQVLAPAPSARP
jgi:hypothetical protein